MDKRADLGHGDVKKLLFSLSVPTITSQIVNMLYNHGRPCVHRPHAARRDRRKTRAHRRWRMPADHHGHLGVRVAHGHRRRAARVDLPRAQATSEKSERIMGNCLTMLVITALVLTALFESFGRAAFTDVRREREHHRLCASTTCASTPSARSSCS